MVSSRSPDRRYQHGFDRNRHQKRAGSRQILQTHRQHGLYLLVTPSGARYWRTNYRYLGKQKTLAFGVYPDTGLAEAREQRDAARKVLARGDDPAEKIKLDRIAATVAASNSFKTVADEWLAKVERGGRFAVTMKKLRWLLDFINAAISAAGFYGARAAG